MFKNEKGFTLIEMMIVLLIIAILLIITIPNVAKHNSNINEKGCDAFKKMVQAQVQAYRIDNIDEIPTLAQLVDGGYISASSCPDGRPLSIDNKGEVLVDEKK